ncbi:MAG TPA: ATP-dependent DNA helicase [Mycobacteriales bacterium]|nr:ATP-dependent DNA helicase [Mycobacteriales bacterium]
MARQVRYLLDTTPPPAIQVPTLDEEQRAVVEHRGGPLLVLAGPGTGKTTTLVEAVVDRVERDGVDPDRLLVLTFSRKAADELRERISGRLARTVATPSAYTFHSWCYAIVRAYDVAPGADPPRLLSGAERDVRVHELLVGNAEGAGQTRWPEELAPALRLRGFAREVADLLDRARERGLDGASLRQLGDEAARPGWVSAGSFLDEYLQVLDSAGELDYAGLVHRAVALLHDPSVGAEVAGRYAAVFVDEYQDTDPAQKSLLQRLAGSGRELVVVGDPDQSIYAFRGADVRNILDFPAEFPGADGQPARTIALRRSRRAGTALLAASRAIAERIPVTGALAGQILTEHRRLLAVVPDGPPPEVRLYPTVAEEVTGIADLLRRAHLEDGLPWSEMAVLVRSGVRSIPVLRRAFATAGVPVAVAADEVALARDPTVAPLLAALDVSVRGWSALADPDDAIALLQSPLGRAVPSALRALGRRLRALDRAAGIELPRPSADAIRDALADPRDLVTVEDWIAEPVRRLHSLLASAIERAAAGASPEEVLWLLWERSGWGRRLAAESARGGDSAHAADRDLNAALALFGAASRLEDRRPHAGVGALLDEISAQQIPAGPLEERPGVADAVRLLTAHRSKGLEWSLVVVAGVQDGWWPDLRRRGSLLEPDRVGVLRTGAGHSDGARLSGVTTTKELLADERRLFYVACTRAKHRLVATAVASLDDSGERPSRFLDELGLRDITDESSTPVVQHGGTELLAVHSLVARLRRCLQDPTADAGLRQSAAVTLARLADAQDVGEPLVPSADPGQWWGLVDVTPGVGPVRDPGQPVRLSGSGVASFERCPLQWFLEREVHARGASSAAQGFGTVVHALAQAVGDGTLAADPDVLVTALDAVWDRLGFEAPWQAERDRREARAVMARFLRWHEGNARELIGTEVEFRVVVGDAVLGGSADRVERDGDGHLHVVDLKTGKSTPAQKEMGAEPQLGIYQLAAREGGLSADPPPVELGGAELVQLRHEVKASGLPKVQGQAPLDAADPWADALVARVVAALRAEEFAARPGAQCGNCALRASCPAHDEGRQVLPWA